MTSTFEWIDGRHGLGHAAMDETHGEFLKLCRELEVAPAAEWPQRMLLLAKHTESHFAQEELWMRETNFSSRQEHESEHRRLLGEAATMQKSLGRGQTVFARAWLKGLPDWFNTHLATMDSALAAHLKARGVP